MNKKVIHINVKNIIILIAIIVLIIVGIRLTMARYKSSGESTVNTDIAFYVLKDEYQKGNIFIKDIYPSEKPYEYTFSVSNFDENGTAETSIEYTIDLEITTNLPLEFTIYKNETKLEEDVENKIELDNTNQNYLRKIKIKNGSFKFNEQQTDTYKIEVTFPIKYSEEEEYEGLLENINIMLDSKQKLD